MLIISCKHVTLCLIEMYNYYSSIKTQCHANNIMQAIKKITQQGTDKEELKGAFQHVIRELTTYREATNPAC